MVGSHPPNYLLLDDLEGEGGTKGRHASGEIPKTRFFFFGVFFSPVSLSLVKHDFSHDHSGTRRVII